MRKFIGVAAAILALAAPSFGGTLAASPSGGSVFGNANFTIGWSFTVNSPITVVSLAFLDFGGDGLADAHDIAIWKADTTLMVSSTIPAGTVAPLDAGQREVAIAPLLLATGNYVIGATIPTTNDNWFFGSGVVVTTIPEITFGADRFNSGASLTFPSNSNGNPGYFGPNFFVSTAATAAPEPASVLLAMMGLGLVLAGRVRRR